MKERLVGLEKKIAIGSKKYQLIAGSSYGDYAWEFIANDENDKFFQITVGFETEGQKERIINQIKSREYDYVSYFDYEEISIEKLTPHRLWLWLVANTEQASVA